MKCSNCGQELGNGIKFCTNCGCPIEKTMHSAMFMLSTTNAIPGYRVVECYGIVNAIVAHLTKSIDFGIDKISGGISAISDIFNGGRGNYSAMASTYEEVYEGLNKRIIEKAVECGCNAIIGLRYQPQSAVADGYTYIMAYGTEKE